MEQAKKQFKTASFFVLLFAGLSLLNIITELTFGDLNSAAVPEGSPENIVLITKMILLGVSLVILLPKFYVGIKGLKIAKNPDSSKRHITWAMIILVFEALGIISPIMAILNQGNITDQFMALADVALEVIIIYEYIKYAKALAKLAE